MAGLNIAEWTPDQVAEWLTGIIEVQSPKQAPVTHYDMLLVDNHWIQIEIGS